MCTALLQRKYSRSLSYFSRDDSDEQSMDTRMITENIEKMGRRETESAKMLLKNRRKNIVERKVEKNLNNEV